MHWPRIRGLAASAGVRLRAKETEISAAPWALEARETTLLFFTCVYITMITPIRIQKLCRAYRLMVMVCWLTAYRFETMFTGLFGNTYVTRISLLKYLVNAMKATHRPS